MTPDLTDPTTLRLWARANRRGCPEAAERLLAAADRIEYLTRVIRDIHEDVHATLDAVQ